MEEKNDNISIVVPVYYSQDTLKPLCERIIEVMADLNCGFEVILVNDGSADSSWEVILDLAEQHDFVKGINLMRNFGQHNALLCGIRKAQYGITITMDDDLQHRPESIPSLLAKLSEGYDVVYGSPREERHGILRDLASILTKAALSSVMNAKSARHVSAFRIFKTNLRNAFASYNSPNVSIDVLLTWGTDRIGYVEVDHDPRTNGVSHYNFVKLFNHAMNLITGFSTLPLRISTWTGFGTIIFGIGVLLYVLIRYLINGGAVPGFSFLASIISIFAGVQMFTLGIFGEYLGRMHMQSMEKPSYVIQSTSSQQDE
jgi:undecaprenyl-phosphate 4-deoxy-4-formamido-L-arabinose transferase